MPKVGGGGGGVGVGRHSVVGPLSRGYGNSLLQITVLSGAVS